MPIYLVKSPDGQKLIDASTKSVAINHAIKHSVTAETVSASELVQLMQGQGMTVENSGQSDTVKNETPAGDPQPAPDQPTENQEELNNART